VTQRRLQAQCTVKDDRANQTTKESIHNWTPVELPKACGCYLVRFHVLHLVPIIRLAQQNSCYVTKSTMTHLQKSD
jgi:hypothetical protein